MSDLKDRVEALEPWFHNIDLGEGLWTAPDHFLGNYPAFKFDRFAGALPADLTGKSVLDIGCNAGFYSVEMARRGATRVLGIDEDLRYLDQARLVADTLGFPSLEFAKLSVYDVGALGEKFDLVIFMGVLYHLRHPLLALDLIREHVAGDLLLFQTMQQGSNAIVDVPEDHPFHAEGGGPPPIFDEAGYPKMHFIERSFSNDWTNWWAPNRVCSAAMLRASGFAIVAQPEDEVIFARVADVPYSQWGPATVYPARFPSVRPEEGLSLSKARLEGQPSARLPVLRDAASTSAFQAEACPERLPWQAVEGLSGSSGRTGESKGEAL